MAEKIMSLFAQRSKYITVSTYNMKNLDQNDD